MHISEGVLSAPVLMVGAVASAAATAYAIKKMEADEVPQVAMFSSVFFVASLIHVPIGPSSVHLILNGLTGLLLGWSAFPAILVGLTLQAVLFQFGGFTTLGINTLNMALPALICYFLFHRMVAKGHSMASLAAAFASGFVAILLGSLMVALSLVFTGESFVQAAGALVAAHLPVMVIEGILTASCVAFLLKVKPEMLRAGNV